MIVRQGLQCKVGVAQNPGEQIIEVMRDATSETPNRLQLLRLHQLFLQPPPFGYIHDQTEQLQPAAAILVSTLAAHREPARVTIGIEHPEVELTPLPIFRRTP